MIVRVPASSANLGPGFDALGMALTLHALVGAQPFDGAAVVDEGHPASVAFRRGGGEGDLWVRSPIPSGRGMGFSGAVRVGGLLAAHVQAHGDDAERRRADTPGLLAVAAELEGHADNVAASLLGGVVATTGQTTVRVPLALRPAMVMWVPAFATSTDESRGRLAATVAIEDAVFNIGRTALLVAALAAGEVGALREATRDRLHQDVRLARAEPSRDALHAALAAGAWAAWLSGSGPTIAVMCAPDDADRIAAALPAEGHAKLLAVDDDGATVMPPTPPA